MGRIGFCGRKREMRKLKRATLTVIESRQEKTGGWHCHSHGFDLFKEKMGLCLRYGCLIR